MPVISLSVGKNVVDDVLIDSGSGVNVITDDERRRLGLPKPSPAPFNLKMAGGTLARPQGLLRDVKIHIHGIPYIVTMVVLNCSTVKSDYRMLLGRPWLRHAKVICTQLGQQRGRDYGQRNSQDGQDQQRVGF